MMTPRRLLAQLLANGCIYETFGDRPGNGTPVGYAWLADDQAGPGLAWCSMWGMQQQHTHWMPYVATQQLYDRDLLLLGPYGTPLAQLVPWQEAAQLPANYHSDLANWLQELKKPGSVAGLKSWVVGDSLGV